jgi:hypothetical protein
MGKVVILVEWREVTLNLYEKVIVKLGNKNNNLCFVVVDLHR